MSDQHPTRELAHHEKLSDERLSGAPAARSWYGLAAFLIGMAFIAGLMMLYSNAYLEGAS